LIGNAWTSDYGNPDDPDDFDFIYPISPLHNIPDRVLPPLILLTADRMFEILFLDHKFFYLEILTDDDRVVPMHSFKHAATIQYTHSSNLYPLLLRIDEKAGHGNGKSVEKRYDVFTASLTRYPLIEICVLLYIEFRKRQTNGASSLRPWTWSGKALEALHVFFVLFSL